MCEHLHAINKDTPPFTACHSLSPNSSPELPHRVLETLPIQASRVQPYSLNANLFCLLQHLFRHGWLGNDAQACLYGMRELQC